MAKNQLDPKTLGLGGGILWGGCMLLTTAANMATGYATGLIDLMASVYPGYAATASGAVVGTIYGFIDGFVGLFLLAWIYNKLQ